MIQSCDDPKIDDNKTRATPTKKYQPEERHSSFWECFKEFTSSTENTTSTSNELGKDEENLKELNLYIALPLIDRKADPFQWWQLHKTAFAVLAKAARKFLSAPASSFYSERLFSEAGNIYDKK